MLNTIWFGKGTMSLGIRMMQDGEENAVAALIRQLPKDLGLTAVPKMTGQNLRDAKGLAHVTVAIDAGLILGVCLWTMTYSSWRGSPGIYVSDLYVLPHIRGRKIGEKLLRGTVYEAHKRGARFIKMEVDESNEAGARFYARLGFIHKSDDRIFILEPDAFEHLARTK
jgi:ribosomal protein S18 acetylase RimI-like enzyme